MKPAVDLFSAPNIAPLSQRRPWSKFTVTVFLLLAYVCYWGACIGIEATARSRFGLLRPQPPPASTLSREEKVKELLLSCKHLLEQQDPVVQREEEKLFGFLPHLSFSSLVWSVSFGCCFLLWLHKCDEDITGSRSKPKLSTSCISSSPLFTFVLISLSLFSLFSFPSGWSNSPLCGI